MDASRQRRIAQNEDHSRRANEDIRGAMELFQGAEHHLLSLVCECAVRDCLDMVEASLRDYTEVREVATRFIVRPNHVVPDVEVVIEQCDRFWVVEKFDASGAEATRLAELQ